MNQKKRILIAEDDDDIAMIEEAYLSSAGYETVIVKNGNKIETELFENGPFDLLLLDLMLPGKSGYDVCREIRDKTNIPIIMVTARSQTVDKIRGLGLGADDYLAKPFDPAELVARVSANIRQQERSAPSPSAQTKEIMIGDLVIYPDRWMVRKKDQEIKMANKEFELLRFLAEHKNMVFSRDQLFEKIWGYDYAGDTATVMVHIRRIREKIEDDPKNPKLIETVWGAGYRLNSPDGKI